MSDEKISIENEASGKSMDIQETLVDEEIKSQLSGDQEQNSQENVESEEVPIEQCSSETEEGGDQQENTQETEETNETENQETENEEQVEQTQDQTEDQENAEETTNENDEGDEPEAETAEPSEQAEGSNDNLTDAEREDIANMVLDDEMEQAALKIQSTFRGHKTRKDIKKTDSETEDIEKSVDELNINPEDEQPQSNESQEAQPDATEDDDIANMVSLNYIIISNIKFFMFNFDS